MNPKYNLLFVCGRNQWRSPTAAQIYANDQRVCVRSAGVSGKSKRLLSTQDLEWADLVLVMEKAQKTRITETFREIELPPIVSLEIPDDYPFMDPELIELIRDGTEFYLKDIW